jgi:hypothetical protein
MNNATPREFFDTICVGYAYNQNGFNLPADSNLVAGTATYDTTLSNGVCDVSVILHLTKKQTDSTPIVDSFCEGKSFVHNGVIYESAGDYVQFLTSVNGCDSTLHLKLSLKKPVLTELSDSAFGQYIWNDQYYYTSGQYSQIFTAANGCDSIVSKKITIKNLSFGYLEMDSCEQITYKGHTFFNDTTFLDTLEISSGFDSLTIVDLTVNSSFFNEQDLQGTDSVKYLSNVYYRDTTFEIKYQTITGCDSIEEIKITIDKSPEPPEPPITPTDSIETEIVVYWDRVLAVPNRQNLDELRFATYYWYKDGVMLPSSNIDWIDVGTPIPPGAYSVRIMYNNEEITNLQRTFERPFGISAYPNPLRTSEELNIEAYGSAIKRIDIFDINGVLQKFPIRVVREKGVVRALRATPLQSGLYILQIHLDNQTMETLKMVVK